MEKQHGIKLFFVLLASTLFILGFSHFGALGYEGVTAGNTRFSSGTTIGSVNVANKTKAEALTLLTNQLQIWQNSTTIDIKYKEKMIPINLEIYQFDLQKTVSTAQDGHENLVITAIDEKLLHEQLEEISDLLTLNKTEFMTIQTELLRYATNLETGNYQVALQKLFPAEAEHEIIHEISMNLNHANIGISDWINQLSPILISAESQVSFLDLIQKHQLSSMPTDALSMIATGIYQAILPTNFTIIERHISQELPDYAALGYEARVNQEANLDFVFANPNDTDYRLDFQWSYPFLTVQLTGNPLLYNYTIVESDKQEFEPKKVIQFSPQLLPSQITVKDEGKRGQLIKISRKVYGELGDVVTEEVLSEDYYAPIEQIEIHGLSAPSKNISEGDSKDSGEGVEATDGEDRPTEIDRDDKNHDENENETPESDATDSEERDSDEFWGKPNETEK